MSRTANSTHGFTVCLFIPNGDPEGIKVIEMSNWTGKGWVIPRSLYGKDREAFRLGVGVYLLVGGEDTSSFPKVYIGEGDPVGPRLDDHYRNKDFWTHAVIFTSKDQNLNKTHVQYLESRLVDLARKPKRSILDNGNTSQPPSMSDPDISDSEGFLSNMLLCLPILGYGFFEVIDSPQTTSHELFLESKGIKAQGYETSGGFVVRKGSKAVKKEVPSIDKGLPVLRQTLLQQGLFTDVGESYQLTQDYVFNSPSMAAGTLLGRSANGRTEWKDKNGRTLKALQEGEVTRGQ